ncbi:MAG: adenylosuccinate synthase [Neolewinella sp.]|jgi:adenylosuccinate synthase
MTTQIILGLAFGDEGKGVTTDYCCRQAERPLVVRFSGGHQAGHTVVTPEGQRHVFSNFGAGTLAGGPTFWSRYCTFHPVGYANEREALLEMGIIPTLFVDGLAAVTTPYDLLYNRHLEASQKHGSCGLGFGATVARHEGPHKLHVLDLMDDYVLDQKLSSVAAYYVEKLGANYEEEALARQLETFQEAVAYCRSNLLFTSGRAFFSSVAESYDTIVFEGSQGLLLDQDFGYFPHVTRAHVSSRNALELIREYDLPAPEIFYVTRAYQTRHGNGPLTNADQTGPELHPTPYETNVFNLWQGEQRRSLLDLNQLCYALAADAQYSAGLPRHLVVTCLDQLAEEWRATDDNRLIILHSPKEMARRLGGLWAGTWGNHGEVGSLLVE